MKPFEDPPEGRDVISVCQFRCKVLFGLEKTGRFVA
jgi:hypothetical protein